jgi:hypothetical protein
VQVARHLPELYSAAHGGHGRPLDHACLALVHFTSALSPHRRSGRSVLGRNPVVKPRNTKA